jgi:diadenylate cyclase
MTEFIEAVRAALRAFEMRSLLDIVIVAFLVYQVLSLIQGTTAVALLRGMVLVFVIGSIASNLLGLTVLGWLLRNSLPALIIAVPILFQPEIRRVLEEVGSAGGFTGFRRAPVETANQRAIDIVARAAGRLSERNWGGLIVLERQIELGEYAASGVRIDAALSVELLLSVFFPHAPMHDGAVIIRGDRAVSARVVLPLAGTVDTPYQFGTRHRAGIGITEKTDALAIVVSEETGRISICNNGRLVSNLDEQKLRRVLLPLYKTASGQGFRERFRWRNKSAEA